MRHQPFPSWQPNRAAKIAPRSGMQPSRDDSAPALAKPMDSPTRTRLCSAAVVGDSVSWRSTKEENMERPAEPEGQHLKVALATLRRSAFLLWSSASADDGG
uniref:Uncharacterized protein n=1 Tax=mine drainage metagenome TaxID=410659 RepID=E6QQ25_9ZZZZ